MSQCPETTHFHNCSRDGSASDRRCRTHADAKGAEPNYALQSREREIISCQLERKECGRNANEKYTRHGATAVRLAAGPHPQAREGIWRTQVRTSGEVSNIAPAADRPGLNANFQELRPIHVVITRLARIPVSRNSWAFCCPGGFHPIGSPSRPVPSEIPGGASRSHRGRARLGPSAAPEAPARRRSAGPEASHRGAAAESWGSGRRLPLFARRCGYVDKAAFQDTLRAPDKEREREHDLC